MKTTTADRRRRSGLRLIWRLAPVGILMAVALTIVWVRAPLPSWLLPVRRQIGDVLHWAMENWLSTAAVTAMAAVAGVLTPFLIRWMDRHNSAQTVRQSRDAQQRSVMLRRVRYKWITDVLEPSLADAAQLVLGLQRRPDLLDLGGRVVRRPGHPLEPLPDGTPISEVLDKVGGSLLILGPPGSGKTTALLQLCDELLDRAEDDPGQPVPVVVNLSSWASHRPPLGVWLVGELVSSYQVPRRIAIEWVEQDALVLLLDGLDEVAEAHRDACAEAVNAWRYEHGLVPLVVCSRTQELEALGPSLRLEEAVELQPPTDAQVERYLAYLEATGTPLADVRAALAGDQKLRHLLRSPLLLHVVALAYHGRPARALFTPGTVQQRQALLWEAYVARMFEQRPLDAGSGYTKEQALDWLVWLARALKDRDLTEFHLDRLTPDWLATPTRRQRSRLAAGLAAGICAGLVFGLAFALVARAFGLGLGLGLADGLALGLSAGLACGLVGGLVFGLAGSLIASAESAEQVLWSWSKLRLRLIRGLTLGLHRQRTVPNEASSPSVQDAPLAAVYGLAAGLAGGLAGGLVAGPTFGLAAALATGLGCGLTVGLIGGFADGLTLSVEPVEQLSWSWPKLRTGLSRVIASGIIGGLVMGLAVGWAGGPSVGGVVGVVFGLAVGLVGGLAAGLVSGLRDERAVPNEGIRRSVRYSLILGLGAGLIAGLIAGLGFGFVRGSSSGLFAGLGFGLGFGLCVQAVFGGAAYLQHYVVRAWIVREGNAPWRYSPFLEAMVPRLILRRSGSAYLFVHRLLRDYLASANPNHAQAADWQREV